MTYRIVRFYQSPSHGSETVMGDLTLEEAQEHCQDPESTRTTETGDGAVELTRRVGAWFEGYREE